MEILRRSIVYFLALLAIGVLLGFIGPFGTFAQMSPVHRFAYWIILVLLNGIQAQIIILLFVRWLDLPKWPRAVPVFLGAAVCSVLGTLEVLGMEHIFGPNAAISGLAVSEIYVRVFVIMLVLSYLFTLGSLRRFAAYAGPFDTYEEAGKGAGGTTSFLNKLPSGLGGDLLYIEAEDHYLRVHTTLGEGLVLMPMRQAVGELEGYDGMQVHRSFWVARKAVVSQRRAGDGAVLHLSNGAEIPVSRARLRALRKQGLLA